MSAAAAQSLEYVLIPGQGGFPSVISASDAQMRISKNNQDEFGERAARFSDLLAQRGAGHVPFWFTGSDVVIRGDVETAWKISNAVHGLPNMMPAAQAAASNVVDFAPRQHIAPAFAEAVNPLLKAPDMAGSFHAATHQAVTTRRQPVLARRSAMERHAA